MISPEFIIIFNKVVTLSPFVCFQKWNLLEGHVKKELKSQDSEGQEPRKLIGFTWDAF